MADLNPSFNFDFAGALAQTEKEMGASNATSIDYKIAQHLARSMRPGAKGMTAAAPAAAAARDGRGRQAAAAGAASSDSDIEGSGTEGDVSDSDEDAPLPGELDDDESEEEEVGADLALNGGDSDAEADGNEEEVEEEACSEDEIAKAVMDMDSDQLETSSEEEEEEEEAPLAKHMREQQAVAVQHQQAPRRGAAGAADGQQQQPGEQEQAGKKRKAAFFDAAPKETKYSAKDFANLGLSRPLVKACQVLGYSHPTPIQAACIPLAMAGRDICGSAVTGSGKTAAFGLPILERLLHRNKRVAATYVLVLTPVRELAVQVHSMIQKLAQFTDIQAALVVGGLSLQAQAAVLRAQPEIVVATPGRMIDHLRNTQSVGLEDLAVLVLDEADRLLEMGFAEEIREVVRMAPERRQTMLFSATMTEEVRKLVALSLTHPVRLAADAVAAAPKELTQEILRLKGGQAAQKEATLLALCSRLFKSGRTIIFAKTKQRAHRLKILFGLAGLPPAGELHGDMTQAARLESLERFRKGDVAFLLATELAARGLDILGVEAVVNFDCPAQFASYLHRVGRTARAGAQGRALTFIEDNDRSVLKEVIKRTGVQMQQRQVQQAAINSWQHKLEQLEGQVADIIQEEREERALRKAEMEAQKATNLLEHQNEIFSRPARTWFQTEKQKKELARQSKEAGAAGGGGGNNSDDEGGERDPMTGQQKRNKAKNERRLEQKQLRAKEAAEKAKNKRNKLMDETAAASRSIRAVKAKEQQLRLEGVTGGRAGKMAASMVTGVKRKKKKGKEGGQELFDGDGLPAKPASAGGSKVYSGGAHSSKLKVSCGTKLGKAELNKVRRGGKGKHSFKSKAKHRRR